MWLAVDVNYVNHAVCPASFDLVDYHCPVQHYFRATSCSKLFSAYNLPSN